MWISFAGIIILCLTHIFVQKLKLSGIPRSKLLSVAGGISVTFIFLEAMPELREYQEKLSEEHGSLVPGFEEISIFLIALFGLVFFYGLENRTKKSSSSRRETPSEVKRKHKPKGFFWIHVSSFAVYNFIIGYLLLRREEDSLQALILYVVAMSFHFIVTDHSLEDHFKHMYKTRGRWILVVGLFAGWIVSLLWTIPLFYVGLIFSFVIGGVIMNVLKEELPAERDSNFFAFLGGVAGYALLLALV